VLLAHADGFNWDEALMVLAPIAIIAGVLLYANNKLQRGLGDQLLEDPRPTPRPRPRARATRRPPARTPRRRPDPVAAPDPADTFGAAT